MDDRQVVIIAKPPDPAIICNLSIVMLGFLLPCKDSWIPAR
jgi:hypothetical protein